MFDNMIANFVKIKTSLFSGKFITFID